MKTKHIAFCPICGDTQLKPAMTCTDHFATGETFVTVQCQNCTFVFTQDFPSENNIGAYYNVPSYISHSDTHKGLINTLYHWARKSALKSKSKIVIREASVKKGTLLDIGCGTGYFLDKMKKLKWVVTGIEKSDETRRYAKERFGLDCQNSEYLFDIKPQTKDVITMWHVLEHIESLDEVMVQLHSILKDSGVAIIALPNKDSYDAKSYKEHWAAYDVPRHLWHFSPNTFSLLANKHQFEIKEMKPMYFDTFYISMLSEKNKNTFCASLIGLLKGALFFLRSLRHTQKCSSIIYILKKKS